MSERGVHATGVADLLAHSNTARNSIYQHFPRGKTELMEQATFSAGHAITGLLDTLLTTRRPAAALDGVIDYWAHVLCHSDYAMGCPILAASLSGPADPGVSAASAAVFAEWTDRIAAALSRAGADPALARPIASTAVSAIEGAITQSRCGRTTQPLDDVRQTLAHLIGSAIPATA